MSFQDSIEWSTGLPTVRFQGLIEWNVLERTIFLTTNPSNMNSSFVNYFVDYSYSICETFLFWAAFISTCYLNIVGWLDFIFLVNTVLQLDPYSHFFLFCQVHYSLLSQPPIEFHFKWNSYLHETWNLSYWLLISDSSDILQLQQCVKIRSSPEQFDCIHYIVYQGSK